MIPRFRTKPRWQLSTLFAAAAIAAALVAIPLASGAAATTPQATAATSVTAQAVLPVVSCASLTADDLSTLKDAPTSITNAKQVAATSTTPAYCDILGYVAPQVQFEVRLPLSTWNGDFFQTGCGGFCGSIPISSCNASLSSNFAVAAENTGHVGSDGLWAFNNRPAEIDFGYRSPHVVALAAKALIKEFYGQGPHFSYYDGCSTGGRQALSEAQRYPHDFNGIVAGDPANEQNFLAPIAQGWVERVNRDKNNNLILTDAQLPLIHNAVLAACDGIDGHLDGVLDDASKCHWSPTTLTCKAHEDPTLCLTPAQVKVAEDFYSGPKNSRGQVLMPGLPLGSELGWAGTDIGTNTSLSGAGNFATQVLRYLAFQNDPGPTYTINDFNLDKDIPKLDFMAKIYNATNPDLSAFKAAGGKLILYHGGADPLISPQNSVNYFNDVQKVMGGTNKTAGFFRFFVLPGVFHCTGGAGADTVNWMSYIQSWVEDGTAPASITATKVANGTVTMTRVLRPFPRSPLR
ncbi:MAG TPA: tannase/feruloyl esterase family alpha/beta hydrolase [Pseudonocardiaceae bacterium]|nr:tannase/feruloyl esterase family alpha/beta hydrolase [Pseudonocardiaceae bacterium]